MTLRIVTVVGARPQFIKAAAVSRAIRQDYGARLTETLVHTGQHYDANMSRVFFDELDIPAPAYNLGITSSSHGAMTGRMIEGLEEVFLKEKPDWVLIYGDTNSTLAAALAAAKLHIPVAHVEAGLRSYNMRMPEEINRVLADRVSTFLFCPTDAAVRNLAAEGVTRGVHNVGDVMFDASLFYRQRAQDKSDVLTRLGLSDKHYSLATCHRAENTDDVARLRAITEAFAELSKDETLVLPLHPRTRKIMASEGFDRHLGNVKIVEPLPFLDMIRLEQSARVILTDSGGVQKEAFFYGVPCVTMRDETEWVETVELGCNRLAGASTEAILDAYRASKPFALSALASPYGDGHASNQICEWLQTG